MPALDSCGDLQESITYAEPESIGGENLRNHRVPRRRSLHGLHRRGPALAGGRNPYQFPAAPTIRYVAVVRAFRNGLGNWNRIAARSA